MAICQEIDFARIIGMEVIDLAQRFSGLQNGRKGMGKSD